MNKARFVLQTGGHASAAGLTELSNKAQRKLKGFYLQVLGAQEEFQIHASKADQEAVRVSMKALQGIITAENAANDHAARTALQLLTPIFFTQVR